MKKILKSAVPGAQQVGDGEKVQKKGQKNVAKVNGGTSPETVGKMSADEKLMSMVNKIAPKKMAKC